MEPVVFTLPSSHPPVEVILPAGLCTQEQLLSFRPFKEWVKTLEKSIAQQRQRSHIFHAKDERYTLQSIEIQSVDFFRQQVGTGFIERLGFVKLKSVVANAKNGRPLPGIVFLRGGSVAILMIIQPEGSNERLVVLTQQPRIPAGSLAFYEIPAGMIDDEDTFTGAAAKELFEETGLKILAHELVDMTELALKDSQIVEDHLRRAMYPSPGGCDEFVSLFLWERTMSPTEINELRNRINGVDNEVIKTKLVDYNDVWREGARDAKTLAAVALFEGLERAGAFGRT